MSEQQEQPETGNRMPVVFVGHGSPMNAIEDNQWSRGFKLLGNVLPRPNAILAISAHWYVDGTYVMANSQPPTIHDFGGFPDALYEIEYPARGNKELVEWVSELLGKSRVQPSETWGLDHGTWSVLRWIYPDADVPVVQLSIDRRLDARQHYELGRTLAALRDRNVLILASGNVVHNLRDAFRQMRTGTSVTPDWASRFDETVKQVLLKDDVDSLLSLWPDSEDGRLAHPTPDHWLPLIYAAAAADEGGAVNFPTEGFDLGSLSMRNVVFG